MIEVYINCREVNDAGEPVVPADAVRHDRFFASIEASHGYAYIGPLRDTQEQARQDARQWLDARGMTHPVTHPEIRS